MEQFQVNLEALRTMVVVITNDRSWTVKRDDSLITGVTKFDEKTIYLTTRSLPKGLPEWKMERMLDGLCAHEAGHIVVTMPYTVAYGAWMQTKTYPLLAKFITNVFEDLRVNFYVANRYRFDFGGRMEELHRLCVPAMIEHAKNLDINKKRLEKAVMALTLKTLADQDVTYTLDSVAGEAVRKAADALKSNKFKRVTKDLIATLEEAYTQIASLVRKPKRSKKPQRPPPEETEEEQEGEGEGEAEGGQGEGEPQLDSEREEGPGEGEEETGEPSEGKEETTGEEGKEGEEEDWDGGEDENYDRDSDPDYIPNVIGGNFQLDATRQEIEQAMEEQRKMEEEARKAAEELAKQLQAQGIASGITTGIEEPHPEPNATVYRMLVQRNTQYISALLNRLKSLQKIRWSTTRFARRGRYMIELHPLWKTLAQGKGKPYDKRFEGHALHYDEVKTKMALLVDMSGSMNEDQARDALTIISEVCGRWIPSEDFAIAVFGTNHALVKAFVEPYFQARTRIGGVWGMGSTNLHRPLQVLIKMLSSFRRTDFDLVLVIVSDFWQTDGMEEESKKAIQEAERMGIKVIGCGLCQSDLARVQEFTTRATYIENVYQLPALFFRIYRATISKKLP